MSSIHIQKVTDELGLRSKQVANTVQLLDEGASIPFVARYRKENTGSLDEVVLTKIRDRIHQLRELDKRREAVLESIRKQEKLTPELEEKINAAETMTVLEDLYLPYKPKRRTRATVAKEKGLEPLAALIFEQKPDVDPKLIAADFIDPEKKVETVEDALAGARDIIAEWVNEDAQIRAKMRQLFMEQAKFTSRIIPGKEKEGVKFKDYFEWEEPVSTIPSHRLLALRRGEKEEFLLLRALPPQDAAHEILTEQFVLSDNACSKQVQLAVEDSYKRMLSLSIENEIRMLTKQEADDEAIAVFAENLRQLLMAAALGEKSVLAIDPGFRTGCKVVCLNQQGKLLTNTTIFISQSDAERNRAETVLRQLITEHNVEFIAIGNGTASRETESFIRQLNFDQVQTVMVNESGASIYSASDVAREEFPDYDVTVRGAVSIGRRLQDPLAELVKIDPKNIGVGQYQHDVDQAKLKKCLDDVVMSCVNQVGVEVNTSSKQLLMYVSGLGPALAQAMVDYRNENGPFQSRGDFLNVAKLGAKAYEQAAGFLRIRGAENPLDTSSVHPESYGIVQKMADDVGCKIKDLMAGDQLRNRIDVHAYVTDSVGLPTLRDIMEELAKPGRDPREEFEIIEFEEGINTIEDLTPGMSITGVVTNITNFGCFVDIGVHHDGLVHISEMSDKYIKHPTEVVKVAQRVDVTVIELDLERKRIALSMKSKPEIKS